MSSKFASKGSVAFPIECGLNEPDRFTSNHHVNSCSLIVCRQTAVLADVAAPSGGDVRHLQNVLGTEQPQRELIRCSPNRAKSPLQGLHACRFV